MGFVTVADTTHIVVSSPGAWSDTFYGSFTYGLNGSVTGGVLTEVDETNGSLPVLTVTNLSIAAAPYATAVLAGDTNTALNLLTAGSDSIQGSIYGDGVYGGGGNDTVIALDGNDTIDGGDGNDDVNGNKGEDAVLGGAGDDTVRGGQGDDTIFGGDGNDPHVNGNIGNDSVSGGNGNDTVYGGQGNDTILGDAGNDSLSGDLGNDIMLGGAGADRFYIAPGGGIDAIGDFHPGEGDRIAMPAGTHYTVTSVSGQVVLDLGAGTEIVLTGIAAGTFSADWVIGV
ncbi:MAG TPA: calcium-binding protein [Caulobacteraceae bacterium]|nr:calcium-binding protein [Caulobacteraceae bacterium]